MCFGAKRIAVRLSYTYVQLSFSLIWINGSQEILALYTYQTLLRDKICFADLTRGKYRTESAIWLLSLCGTTLVPAKKAAFIARRRRGGVLLQAFLAGQVQQWARSGWLDNMRINNSTTKGRGGEGWLQLRDFFHCNFHINFEKFPVISKSSRAPIDTLAGATQSQVSSASQQRRAVTI